MKRKRGFFGLVGFFFIISLFFVGPGMAAPKGEVRVLMALDIGTIDPSKTRLSREFIIYDLMYQELSKVDPVTGKQVPSLAQSITPQEGGKSWLIKARPLSVS